MELEGQHQGVHEDEAAGVDRAHLGDLAQDFTFLTGLQVKRQHLGAHEDDAEGAVRAHQEM